MTNTRNINADITIAEDCNVAFFRRKNQCVGVILKGKRPKQRNSMTIKEREVGCRPK
jgi:hypothetical protein